MYIHLHQGAVISLGEGWENPTLWTGGAGTPLAHPSCKGWDQGMFRYSTPESSILPNLRSEVRYQ